MTALWLAVALFAADDRLTYHRVTNARSPRQEAGVEGAQIPSLVEGLATARDWTTKRRPQLVREWTNILGRLEPRREDRRWFPDIRTARIGRVEDRGAYERIELDLQMEAGFWQPHLLLRPKRKGRLPAVIAWTSTTPDYKAPEQWWGAWLAERGYVVLCGWSFLRNYRDHADYRAAAHDKVHERFGRWMGVSKMAHDAHREAEYLVSLRYVDAKKIGFIGFSLGAKAALYVAAFTPDVSAVVSLDPHIALNGGTNWFAPWYMDWIRPFPDIATPERTVLSLLDRDPSRAGLEHDHHEILALAAPKPLLIIGGSDSEDAGGDSDDRQSWGYVNRAREVYALLGVRDRLRFVLTGEGHKPNGAKTDEAWREFFARWLPAPSR